MFFDELVKKTVQPEVRTSPRTLESRNWHQRRREKAMLFDELLKEKSASENVMFFDKLSKRKVQVSQSWVYVHRMRLQQSRVEAL